MFQAPFLHVDPHAGNLFVRKDPISGNPQLVLLDHGMYNYFESGFNEFLQNLWLAMVAQDSKEMDRLCRQFHLEKYAQLLALSMTGRSMTSHNKFGEEMSEEMHDSIEERMANSMKTMTAEIFQKRIGIVEFHLSSNILDFWDDGCDASGSDVCVSSDRDDAWIVAVAGRYRSGSIEHHDIVCDKVEFRVIVDCRGKVLRENTLFPWLVTIRWKVYLYFLRFRLWLNDLYVEYYFRHYLQYGYEMEFDPNVIFDKLIK